MRISKKTNLTPAEKRVLKHLASAWNEFIKLPVAHPDDVEEFKVSIHHCQNLIAFRVARRVDPKQWS